MQMILRVLMRIMAVVAVFLPTALIMGKKHVGELSVLDLMIALTLGSAERSATSCLRPTLPP